MESRYRQAASLLAQAGYEDLSSRLEQELHSMTADTYRIAVIGEFKTGKSTLINRVFIKENILFTDIMEATAVPTEIRYAPDKYLEVIPYQKSVREKLSPFDESVRDQIEECLDEGKPFRIENPTSQDIQKYTSAKNSEDRALLAKSIARVRLSYPSVNLAGLTVFDTPGINSINEAVIMTTYRVIPESDMVLFVTDARQLSTIELEYLTSRIFSEGVTRIMIVIIYDPNALILTERQKENLMRTIKSQLASCGHPDIPVELVNIRDSGKQKGSESGRFKERIEKAPELKDGKQTVSAVIGSLLGSEPPAAKTESAFDYSEEEKYGISQLEETIIRFIRENIRPARIEKATKVLTNQLSSALFRAKSEYTALLKTEEERRILFQEIQSREQQIRSDYELLTKQFHDELTVIRNRFTSMIAEGLEEISKKFIDGFDACQDLGELQERLNLADVLLKRDIETLFIDAGRQMTDQILEAASKYEIKSQNILNPWQSDISRGLSIQGGIFANIPPSAVLMLDFSLFLLVGPLKPLARVLIRMVANEIPFINKVLPAAMAASAMKFNVKRSLAQQFKELKTDIHFKLIHDFQTIEEKIIQDWKLRADDQLKAVRFGVERTLDQSESKQRQTFLEEFIRKSEEMIGLSKG